MFCGHGGAPGDSGNPQSAASGVDDSAWPPKLRKYVERAFAMCVTDGHRLIVETNLKNLIKDANATGSLWGTNWNAQAMPDLPDVDPSTVSTAVVARAGAIPLRSDVSPAATAAGAADAQGVGVAHGAHSATAVQVVDSRDASPRMSVPSASATCTATVSDDRHGWQGPTQTAAGTATAHGVGVAREGNPPMRGGSQRYSACKQNECQLPCRSC